MGGLRAEFAAGTETPHPSHRKKQALPAVHPNSKPWGKLPQLVRVPHCSATLEQYVPAERISTLREIADQGSPILAGVADRWSATE
jgi:hypothetical protein